MNRRAFVAIALSTVSSVMLACESRSKAREERCKHCGMKIDRASAWRVELVLVDGSTVPFDTPRCALTSWRSGKTPATSIRVQDYYDRTWRNGADVRFVIGGDVVGPMGPDLVPVDPARATKFIQDHTADRALRLEEVTLDVLLKINN